VPAQPVGPFPAGADPEGYDRLRRRILWRMPVGLYLLGSASGERRNLMTHSLAVQVATEPKLLAVAIKVDAVTHQLVREGRVFSLCFLKREDRALVRGFTKPVTEGPEPGLLGGVAVRAGTTGAPLVVNAAAWLECEVRHELALGDHTLFVGEVIDCSAPDEDAPILRMEDTRLNYGG
jgi:flavin reductase (DIM6/NTAB) family NADH-FMN oxidoreductase RutF